MRLVSRKVQEKFLPFQRDGPGVTSLERHSIKLMKGAQVFKDRPYPMSPAKLNVVKDEIDKMLELGVIEESKSPSSNLTTVVSKPGKDRLCLDARKLTALTIKDAYSLPSIEGIISRIDQTHYISTEDLKFAFWQIEVDDRSKVYTAFTVPGRPFYQFRMIPYGLCNAAHRLVRLMDRVILAELRSNVFVYLDNLLVLVSDFQTHLKYLRRVAHNLESTGLTIGLKKVRFC